MRTVECRAGCIQEENMNLDTIPEYLGWAESINSLAFLSTTSGKQQHNLKKNDWLHWVRKLVCLCEGVWWCLFLFSLTALRNFWSAALRDKPSAWRDEYSILRSQSVFIRAVVLYILKPFSFLFTPADSHALRHALRRLASSPRAKHV